MRPYPAYKESGVEWLGQVPEGWEVCLAKRAITVRSGDMISATEETDGGFPIIGGNGVRAYTDKTNSDADTLVIGRVGALCGCVHHITEPFWASEHAYRVVERKQIDRRYFFYLLTSLNLNQFAIKTAQPLLNTEIVESRWIPLPPHPEQQAIAAFLDRETAKIDGLIEEQRRMIALLAEKRQATISHAVTRGLNPSARLKPSGVDWLGDIPEGWEVVRFSRLVSIAEGQVDPEVEPYASMVLIAPNHIESGTGRLLAMETASEQGAVSGKYLFEKGAVVYSKIRPALAKIVHSPVAGLCSADMYPLTSRGKLDHGYLTWVLLTPGFTAWATMESDRVAMPKINREKLNELMLPVPPLTEQVKIAAHIETAVSQLDALTETATTAITLLQERRAALISAAVTGKIDVRDLAPAQAA
jgi:type I restriction enzyme S subunit